MRICTKCKLEIDEANFGKRKNSPDGLNNRCKFCINKQTRERLAKLSGEALTLYRERRKKSFEKFSSRPDYKQRCKEREERCILKNPARHILTVTRNRAKREGIPFNLELDDIVIPEYCPVLGIKLIRGKGTKTDNSPSIDKVIPELGYIKGNVHIISEKANRIKSNATPEELMKVAMYFQDEEELASMVGGSE